MGKTASPAQPAPPPPVLGVMLRREEMLDSRGRLAGYRFSIKANGRALQEPPSACLQALQAANVKALAERRLAVVTLLPGEWQQADFASLNAAHTVFQVELTAPQVSSDDALTMLQQIRQSGAGLALSCAPDQPPPAAALALATHCFVDFTSSSIEHFERLVKGLRSAHPGLVLAVCNVSTWPERRLCMALGIEYAMGRFLASMDEQDKTEKLTESRLVLMELLNLVRKDADAQALADVAKRDPGVAVQLLSMANSPAYGLRQSLTGIDQAIMVLGRETLYRWLAVSMFRAGKDAARDEALLEVALARARFLELAALAVSSKQQADELFLVGLLSFVDSLLGMPMKEVLTPMSLPAVVKSVLLNNEGPYVPYLMLSISVEKCQADRITQLAGALGMALDTLNELRNAALLWAEQAVH